MRNVQGESPIATQTASPRADPQSATLVRVADGRWRLAGVLNLRSVAALARQVPEPSSAGRVQLDLSEIERASSAGVALLLEWQAELQAQGAALYPHNPPEALRRLAELANVDGLLHLHSRESDGQTTDHRR